MERRIILSLLVTVVGLIVGPISYLFAGGVRFTLELVQVALLVTGSLMFIAGVGYEE